MKFVKILFIIIAVVIIAVLGLLAYLKFALPNIEAKPIEVEITKQRVERGEYLANHVTLCMDCHSERDWSKFAGPPIEGTMGQGGELFDEKVGFPGRFISPNITPYGIGNWTDGELYRAITSGVNKDGKALFPIMPYHNFSKMSMEDIKSIIAYIRTLEPIEKDLEESKANFPLNFIMNTMPKEANHQEIPSKSNIVEYGQYITVSASCYDCHTKQEKGKFIGEDYAGGMEFKLPTGDIVRTPNITPHESGIGNWSEKMFVNKFKMYADSGYVHQTVQPGEYQSPMPWTMYGGMKEEDIKAIYAYLRTVKPVDNFVEKFTPAKN